MSAWPVIGAFEKPLSLVFFDWHGSVLGSRTYGGADCVSFAICSRDGVSGRTSGGE